MSSEIWNLFYDIMTPILSGEPVFSKSVVDHLLGLLPVLTHGFLSVSLGGRVDMVILPEVSLGGIEIALLQVGY